MLSLQLLGSAAIEADRRRVTGRCAQRHHIALLALLVSAPRHTLNRDKLLGLLWPESSTKHARNLLNVSVYEIRRALGDGALESVGDALHLGAGWRVDVAEFEDAFAAREPERAVSVYAGPFLDGFFLADAPEFNSWQEAERHRLARRYADALRILATRADTGGDPAKAVEWWRRLAAHDPYDSYVALGLMRALARTGNRAGAVQHAKTHAALLAAELGIEQDGDVTAFAVRLANAEAAADGGVARRLAVEASGVSAEADRRTIAIGPDHLWRRATRGRVLAAGAFIALAGTFSVLSALGLGPVSSLIAAGSLRGNEPILVADFRVSDADSALGAVITEAVRAGLDQSAAITIVPTSRVSSALQRMQRAADSRVDLPLAREIAQREGIRAIVDGDVTPLAGGSVLTIRLLAAESGDELASFRASVSGAKDLIPALDKLTRALRAKMGESLRSVSASAPLEQVTTPSLEALRKYVEAGRVLRHDADYQKAIRLLKEAIALDTSFAMAYRKLAAMVNTTGLPRAERDSALARAYRYRNRLTDRERLHTVAFYYFQGPGRDRAQSAAAYEDLLSRYPTYIPALNDLAFIYLERREYARAETLLRRIPQVDSGQWNPNLVSALFDVGKTAAADSARATAARVYPRAPQGFVLDVPLVQASYGLDSVARLLDAARVKPDAITRSVATRRRAEVALARGRLSEALALLTSAHAIDSARGAFVPALYDSVKAARMDVWFRGNRRRAVRRLDAVLLITPLRTESALGELYFSVASVYALAGRPDKARAILARYRAEVRDTAQLRVEEPASHEPLAEIALAERRPYDAVTEFRLAEVAPDGPAHGCAVCTYADLARAFDQAEMPDSAIAYFERYLNTPYTWRLRGGPVQVGVDAANLARAYKRLGELYDARGDRQKAASYYEKFVELWKNADPELQPTVGEVRRRLAR